MDQEIGFEMFKNILYNQNKALLCSIAKDYRISQDSMLERYLQREFYLPIIQKNDGAPPTK